ncbi:MAG TPA: hypothetical protein PLX89_24155 [Verrucomicrobiota bacterium]|nr:hypothetical protein [Verrucomicrobiales bacterium]HRI16104.1 hypothetical protein [Verrucomicrobiota bacterium]
MKWVRFWFRSLLIIQLLAAGSVSQAQIDPDRRQIVQVGYDQPLEGRGPLAAYAYFYWNEPSYPWTNTTLRAVIAPTYIDSELGFKDLLGPGTSVGVGITGGGFSDSYAEVRQGNLYEDQSFFGASMGINASIYHTFNPREPGERPTSLMEVPLQFMLRNSFQGAFFSDEKDTSPFFVLPENQPYYNVRTGFRWGGREPLLYPDAAFEISGWYELSERFKPGPYGFAGDRSITASPQLFWGRMLFIRKFTNQIRLEFSITGGGSKDADRFSAYRLGGALPLGAEFPLMIPGYYTQEISATSFALVSGYFQYPITEDGRWEIGVLGAAANVRYLPGFSLGKPWNSGLGGGFSYHSPAGNWHILVGYGYGFNAIRNGEPGGSSIGIAMQYDFLQDKGRIFRRILNNMGPSNWRGLLP